MEKVALLGPTLPWRGGIARHTTELHRALSQRVSLCTIGLRRQYPDWLFPGRFQHEPGYEHHREPGVEYLVDSLAPRTWLAARKELVAFQPKQLILPWWTLYWAPLYRLLVPTLKSAGSQIHFLCHNVVEHESNALRRALTRGILAQGDRLVAQAPDEAERLREWFPGKRIDYLPHPVYAGKAGPAARPARDRLQLLFFGIVRPYKGLDTLLAALQGLDGVHLTVVGEWWKEMGELRAGLCAAGVTIVDRYVSEEEAAAYFAAADAVVLPYHQATGSGVLALALGYGKPVIVSDVGGMADAARAVANSLVVPPGDVRALAEAIRRVPELPSTSGENVAASWTRYVDHLLE